MARKTKKTYFEEATDIHTAVGAIIGPSYEFSGLRRAIDTDVEIEALRQANRWLTLLGGQRIDLIVALIQRHYANEGRTNKWIK